MQSGITEFFQTLSAAPLLNKLIAMVLILLATWLVESITARMTRRFLRRDDNDLPANTIFVNIVRVFVWVVGISTALYFCFDIEMTGIIAALGIGGIALSLGFKDTISDLIGGVQLSMGKIVKADDFIRCGKAEGRVLDVTWRDTRIQDIDGHVHIIPNATLNASEIVQLKGPQRVETEILLPQTDDLDRRLVEIRRLVKEAVERITQPLSDPEVFLNGSVDGGIQATVRVDIEWFSARPPVVKDAVTESIAEYIVPSKA